MCLFGAFTAGSRLPDPREGAPGAARGAEGRAGSAQRCVHPHSAAFVFITSSIIIPEINLRSSRWKSVRRRKAETFWWPIPLQSFLLIALPTLVCHLKYQRCLSTPLCVSRCCQAFPMINRLSLLSSQSLIVKVKGFLKGIWKS